VFSLEFHAPLSLLVFLYGQGAPMYALYLTVYVPCDLVTYFSFNATCSWYSRWR